MKRRLSRTITIGGVKIGGRSPVVVQSMTKTATQDVVATVKQIKDLGNAGCELVRLAVPDMEAASALREIKSQVSLPLVADIHFDYRLALAAIENGADGLRLNPGNIRGKKQIQKIVAAAASRAIPIRIGVNSGSLDRATLKKYGHPTPEAMVESALGHVRILEDLDFHLIKISLKSPDVLQMVSACRLLSERVDYPLHLGVTEAGTLISGTVKNALGIGLLLSEGIGDTIRVSLTHDPVAEVKAAYEILRALGLRQRGVEIISCPTCGRCQIDLLDLAEKIEDALNHITAPLKVAIMGCVVNGPGEAREADVGIACGPGQGTLFRKGKVVKKVTESDLARVLITEVKKMADE
ncbi:MAG: flavodoxin-dependent (E)-4-hydroxy-3-methylbut-2-enyl-diphosphate synthase [Deltaproteobacteria bacterium]|nr:MAG: flavodoxin-dependent (E)-4-hydroxy-3-methylbut-2-enyl-diphosphate synthase [Deltaproteobacteria bacterium]